MDALIEGPKTRKLAKTGIEVTSFGLGGEGILRTWAREPEAVELIWRALELGITYFDCAHEYAGSEDYHGAVWGEHPRLRQRIFLCSKSAQRTKIGARRELEVSLRRMQTDYLDLWQIHDLRTMAEWEQVSGPGGALEAFTQAYQAGLVRFIGITGHHDPAVLQRAIGEFEFHTLLMPVNYAESRLDGFLNRLLPAAVEKGMAVIGMKALAGGMLPRSGLPVGPLLRFALSLPVSTIVTGCETIEQLETNLAAAQEPFSDEDRTALDVPFDAEDVANYRGILKNVQFAMEGL